MNKRAFNLGMAFRAGMDYGMKRRIAQDDWVTLQNKEGEYYHVDLPGENPNKKDSNPKSDKKLKEKTDRHSSFGEYEVRYDGQKAYVFKGDKLLKEADDTGKAREWAHYYNRKEKWKPGSPLKKPVPPDQKTAEVKPAEKHEPSVQVAKPTDLDTKQIERAYAWRSFDPEKKAERIQKEYSSSVNDLYREMSQLAKTDVQKEYLENQFKIEQERILNKYKDAIYADGRTASAAITGGANFNYSKNSDRLDIARRKWDDAYDQFRKARERLTKGIQDAGKTKEQKREEYIGRKVAGYKERLNESPYIDKELFYSRLKTEAKYGNVEVVNRVMEEVKNSNKFTSRHRIFKLPEYAQRMRAYRDANKKE